MSPSGEKQKMSPRGLLWKQETSRKGDEAGQVAGTPGHGGREGQEGHWEALKVEAGGGASGGGSREDGGDGRWIDQ